MSPRPPFTARELAQARATLRAVPFAAVLVPLLFGLLLAATP